MARPLRLEHPDGVWHITSRGNERRDIFHSDRDRLRFLELLGETARRYNWIVYAYVLMSNHFHLVVETPEVTLSKGMHWLNGKYAQWFNRTRGRVGHLFQGRPKALLIEKEGYLLTVLRYVVLNPVRARMVPRPEEYLWSSYRATAGYDASPPWLASDSVLQHFAPDHAQAQAFYREFVDQRLDDPRSPFENLIAQLYLGGEAWIERMKQLVAQKPRPDDHPRAQREIGRPSMAQVTTTVARVFGVEREAVLHTHGGDARMVAAWLGCFEGLLTRRQIAAGLRLRSSGRASNLIGICDNALDHSPKLRIAIERCCDLLRGSPASAVPLGHTVPAPLASAAAV
jgi:putative transposase